MVADGRGLDGLEAADQGDSEYSLRSRYANGENLGGAVEVEDIEEDSTNKCTSIPMYIAENVHQS